MGCLISILVGGFIGWLAGQITRSHMGILGTIIVGMVGSSLGHYLAEVIGLAAYRSRGQAGRERGRGRAVDMDIPVFGNHVMVGEYRAPVFGRVFDLPLFIGNF